jgi:serine-type D-Ala-D-Ala carboxypeptidase (penicillin-binding protein 5/6)
MTMEQTLYGVMLESANECAYAAAEHTGKKLGGDYSTFIDLMNKEAKELGCTDTHFNNANGLPDENHWTSAYDMGLIACAAYRNDEFRKITGTKTYIIPPTNKHTEDTPLYNHHAMLHPFKSYSQFVNQDCTGGKTGYTSVANSTLVTYAEKDGLTLCVVIMNAQSPDQYADTNTLLNYYFSNFKALNIAENENSAAADNTPDLGVMNEHGMYAKVSENYVVLPNNADFSSVKREAADMKSDNKDALATVRYKYGDHVVGCVDLLKSGAKVDLSYFDENSRQNVESDIIRIKPVYFLWVLVLIAVIILSIFMFRRVSDNIYVLKHKWSIKKKQRERFSEHKLERKRRRRRDNLKFSGRHKY